MQKITRESILEVLNQETTYPAVTIYMPTHRVATSPNISEDTIRFKNLIHKAVDIIKAEAGGKPESKKVAQELCAQLADKADDMSFWESRTEGLLICAQPGSLRMYNLPIDTDEYVGVGDQYHLAPLFGMLQDTQDYYVLALAQHKPALYRGDEYGLELIDAGLPESVNAAMNIDENNQQSEQQRSAGGGSLNTAHFNGRGGARDPRENDLAMFMRYIDNILSSKIDRSKPLILAGVDAETAEYRSMSRHPNILDGVVSGNHSNHHSMDELFTKSYAIIREEVIDIKHKAAIEELERLKGADRVAGNPREISEAAEQGRVDKLFVRMTRYTRDTIRDNMRAVTKLSFPDMEIAKAMNEMAIKVWKMSGTVVCLDYAEIPQGQPMVATLRY